LGQPFQGHLCYDDSLCYVHTSSEDTEYLHYLRGDKDVAHF